MRTDGGPSFVSDAVNAHCKTRGIEHMITVAHNPSGHGIVERANSELQRHIRALTTALQAVQPDEWPNRLHLATGIINHAYCSSISPLAPRLPT